MIRAMERYHDPMEKLALAIDSGQIAKSALVDINGIGEDVPATLICWVDDRIKVMIQAGPEHMLLSPISRLSDLSSIALIARGGWMTEAMTLILEGYCSLDENNQDPRPLDEAFIDNPRVSECLTFIHASPNEEPMIAVSPYSVGLGRVTSFLKPRFSHQEPFERHFKPLMDALTHERPSSKTNDRRRDQSARELIGQLGWSVLDHEV